MYCMHRILFMHALRDAWQWCILEMVMCSRPRYNVKKLTFYTHTHTPAHTHNTHIPTHTPTHTHAHTNCSKNYLHMWWKSFQAQEFKVKTRSQNETYLLVEICNNN